jgi:hypothetical protein
LSIIKIVLKLNGMAIRKHLFDLPVAVYQINMPFLVWIKELPSCWALVAHACNPSLLGS